MKTKLKFRVMSIFLIITLLLNYVTCYAEASDTGVVHEVYFEEITDEAVNGLGPMTQDNITLTYSCWQDIEISTALADEFEQKYPNINVEVKEFDISYNDDELFALASTGNLPDCFWITGTAEDFISNSMLYDMTDLWENDPESKNVIGGINEFKIGYMGTDSKWVTPVKFFPTAAFINLDVFNRNDVSMPAMDWTWDEFENTVESMTTYDKIDGEHIFGYTSGCTVITWYPIAADKNCIGEFGWNGTEFDMEKWAYGMNLEAKWVNNWNTPYPLYEGGMEQMSELYGEGVLYPQDIGKAAIHIDNWWTWENLWITDYWLVDNKVVFVPYMMPHVEQSKRDVNIATYDMGGISAYTEYPREAYELLKYMTWGTEGWKKKLEHYPNLYEWSTGSDRLVAKNNMPITLDEDVWDGFKKWHPNSVYGDYIAEVYGSEYDRAKYFDYFMEEVKNDLWTSYGSQQIPGFNKWLSNIYFGQDGKQDFGCDTGEGIYWACLHGGVDAYDYYKYLEQTANESYLNTITKMEFNHVNDEGKLLEEGKYGIKVVNSSGIAIQGATVTYNAKSVTTDSNGWAGFTKLTAGEPAISVSCNGYTSYNNANMNYEKNKNGYEIIVLYTSQESQNRISEATYVNSGLKTDILTGTKRISIDNTISGAFEIHCSVVNNSNVSSYGLWQNGILIANSTDGVFKVTAANFKEGGNVFVRVIGNDGSKIDTHINLSFFKNEELKTANLELGDELSITVDAAVPFLGGKMVSTELPDFPLEFHISDDKVYAGINIDLDGKHQSVKETIEAAKKTFTQLNKLRKGEYPGKTLQKQINSLLKDKNKKAKWAGFEGDFDVVGYGEGTFNENGITEIKLNIALMASISNEFQGPTVVVVVVPMTYSIEVSAEGKVVAEVTYDFETSTLNGDVTFGFTPSLKAFGGAGIGSLVGAGAYGSAKLPIEFQVLGTTTSPGLNSISLEGELGLEAYAGPFEYTRKFLYGTWELYTRTKTYSTISKESYLSAMFDEENYKVTDMAYLSNEISYLGDITAETDEFNNLLTNTYRNSKPQIANVGDKLIMVWQRANVEERETINAVQLVYSVYEDGVWSEAKPVDSDNTIDGEATLYTAEDGTLWLAYTNAKTELSSDAGLDDYASASTIAVACFNSTSMKFENITTVSEDDVFSRMADFSVINNIPTVVWVSNEENTSYFGTNSTNMICYSQYIDGQWSEVNELANGLNAVVGLAVGELNGNMSVSVITDGDNMLETTDDLTLYMYDINGTIKEIDTGVSQVIIYSDLACNEAESLLYVKDGVLISYNGTEGTQILTNGALSNGFSILSDRIIYNRADEDDNSNLYQLLYDENEGKWSDEIKLTNQDYYLQSYSVAEYDEKIYVTAIQSNVEIGEEFVNTCNLSWLAYDYATDISVEALEVDDSSVKAGEVVDIMVDMKNMGDTTISSASWTVLNSMDEVVAFGEFDDLALKPSEEVTKSISILMNETVKLDTYEVMVTAENDCDTTNDTENIKIGYSNLVISAEQIKIDAQTQIAVTVDNQGPVSTSGVLRLYLGEECLEHQIVKELVPGEKTIVFYDINREMTQEKDSAVFSVVVEPNVESVNFYDNQSDVYVELAEEVVYGDANDDGEIDDTDAGLIDKYIAGFENISIDSNTSDVNLDSKIDVLDAVMIKMHIVDATYELGREVINTDSGETIDLTVSSDEGVEGDTVEVYVDISNNPGITGLQFEVDYDDEILEFVSATEILESISNVPVFTHKISDSMDEGYSVGYVLSNADEITANGSILKLEFKVKEDAKHGETKISIVNTNACDLNMLKVNVLTNDGIMTVKCAHESYTTSTVKEASCTQEGKIKYECDVCEHSYEENIPMSEHIWETEYTVDSEPNYEEVGTKSIHCSVCDNIKEGSEIEIPVLEKQYTYGDTNTDGKINVLDAVLMKKYIAGYENLTINLGAADVNADTRVNVMDAVMVLKYIAGFDIVLGGND